MPEIYSHHLREILRYDSAIRLRVAKIPKLGRISAEPRLGTLMFWTGLQRQLGGLLACRPCGVTGHATCLIGCPQICAISWRLGCASGHNANISRLSPLPIVVFISPIMDSETRDRRYREAAKASILYRT